MLDGWHEFYALLGHGGGGAGGAVVRRDVDRGDRAQPRAGRRHAHVLESSGFPLHRVLFVSLIVLIPIHTPLSLGISVGIVAAAGLIYSIVILARLIRDDVADLADHFGYGASPVLAYAAALVAAWLLAVRSSVGAAVLAGALLLLLVVNIRNAWDLTLAFARRQAELNQQVRAPDNGPSQPPSP